MLWGSFGVVHLLSLILSAGVIVGLYFMLRKRSEKVQMWVLGICSLSGIVAIVYNLFQWGSPIEYLPFHLCSLNAIILPIAVFTKNKIICNLTLFWSLGALLAIVVNTAQANYEIFSWTFVMYYVPHTLEFGVPILLFLIKRAKLDVKCIVWTVLITLGAYTGIHFINLGLNAYCIENNLLDYKGDVIQVNYMYSIRPENPVLQLFYNLLPYSYWYMFLCLPIIILYLSGVYVKDIIKLVKKIKIRKSKV